jgi:hypothetical protein
MAGLEPADRLAQPAAILPVLTTTQPARHRLGRQQQLFDITGLDLPPDTIPPTSR